MEKSLHYMAKSLEKAKIAFSLSEVPVGTIITYKDQVVASSYNQVISNNDPTAHAEITAIREAGKTIGSHYLEDCCIYVTLEPCPMCTYAILSSRIKRLYFGAYDVKMGAVEHGLRMVENNKIYKGLEVYGGIMEEECKSLMVDFFKNLR